MKRSKSLISLFFIIVIVMALALSYADDGIATEKIDLSFTINKSICWINDVPIEIDVAPTIIEGRAFLPIRYVATPLGANIKWEERERKVTVSLNGVVIKFWIDRAQALVGDRIVQIDPQNNKVTPIIINGRAMFPVRFLSEELNCNVTWDQQNRQVKVAKHVVEENITRDQVVNSAIAGETIAKAKALDDAVIEMTKSTTTSKLFGLTDFTAKDVQLSLLEDSLSSQSIGRAVEIIPQSWLTAPIGQANSVKADEFDLPIVRSIGRGYDIFGNYAAETSLRQPVLDVKRLADSARIQRVRFDSNETEVVSGRSLRDYSENYKNKTFRGLDFVVFNNQQNMRFDTAHVVRDNYYFSTHSYFVKKYEIYINENAEHLKNYLTVQASAAINSPSTPPSTVFNTYGHYVVIDAISGGRLDYSLSAEKQAATSYQNFQRASDMAAAKYMGDAFSAGVNTAIENEEKFDNAKRHMLNCLGGDKPLTLVQLATDRDAVNTWQDSLKNENTLIDFGSSADVQLLPIWELCNNTARKEQLKAAFEALSAEYVAKLPAQTHIKDIIFTVASDLADARKKCPKGYKLIDKNLYKNTVNSGIYLCYKTGTSSTNTVYDLFFEQRSQYLEPSIEFLAHNGYNANYRQLENNLNDPSDEAKSAGIYLWLTNEERNHSLAPLTEVDVFIGAEKDIPSDWHVVALQNSQAPLSLNASSANKGVYILYRR